MKTLNNYIKEGFFGNIGDNTLIKRDAEVLPWIEKYNKQDRGLGLKLSGDVIRDSRGGLHPLSLCINDDSILEDGHLPEWLPFGNKQDKIYVSINTTKFKSFKNMPKAESMELSVYVPLSNFDINNCDFLSLNIFAPVTIHDVMPTIYGLVFRNDATFPGYRPATSEELYKSLISIKGCTFGENMWSMIYGCDTPCVGVSYIDFSKIKKTTGLTTFFENNRFKDTVSLVADKLPDLNFLDVNAVEFQELKFAVPNATSWRKDPFNPKIDEFLEPLKRNAEKIHHKVWLNVKSSKERALFDRLNDNNYDMCFANWY